MNPISTATSVASTVAAPLTDAFASVGRAMGAILEATKALIPGLDTLGDKFRELGERFKVAFRDHIGIPLFDAVKAVGRRIQFALPTSVIDYFATASQKMGEAVAATGKAVLGLAAAAPVAAGAVAAAGLAMSRLVSKANPAVAEQFTLALNDTLAVLGQMLTPVLQVVTQILRMFGDALVSFSASMGGALGEIASSLMPIFEVLFEVFARVMSVVAEVLKFVAPLIRIVAEGIRTIFEWIGRAVRFVLGLIGIEIGDSPIKKGSSVGAAVRQVGHSDIEGVLRKARESAFSLGTASAVNWQEKIHDKTVDVWVRLGSIADKVQRIFDWLSKPVKTVEDAFDRGVAKIMERLPPRPGPGKKFDGEPLGPFAGGLGIRPGGDGGGTVGATPP